MEALKKEFVEATNRVDQYQAFCKAMHLSGMRAPKVAEILNCVGALMPLRVIRDLSDPVAIHFKQGNITLRCASIFAKFGQEEQDRILARALADQLNDGALQFLLQKRYSDPASVKAATGYFQGPWPLKNLETRLSPQTPLAPAEKQAPEVVKPKEPVETKTPEEAPPQISQAQRDELEDTWLFSTKGIRLHGSIPESIRRLLFPTESEEPLLPKAPRAPRAKPPTDLIVKLPEKAVPVMVEPKEPALIGVDHQRAEAILALLAEGQALGVLLKSISPMLLEETLTCPGDAKRIGKAAIDAANAYSNFAEICQVLESFICRSRM